MSNESGQRHEQPDGHVFEHESLCGKIIGGYRLDTLSRSLENLAVFDATRIEDEVRVIFTALVEPGFSPAEMQYLGEEFGVAFDVIHENFQPVLDYKFANDLSYIVTSYVAGITCGDVIRKSGRVPPAKAVHIAVESLRGLGAAHKKNVVHRRLTPDDIFVCSDGQVRVSKAFGDGRCSSPEVWVGGDGQDITGQADIYSMGCILYYMVTGQLPCDGDRPFDAMKKHLRVPPKPPLEHEGVEISESLNNVILNMLVKRPIYRYKDCDDVIEDLLRAESGQLVNKCNKFDVAFENDSSWKDKVAGTGFALGLVVVAVLIVVPSSPWAFPLAVVLGCTLLLCLGIRVCLDVLKVRRLIAQAQSQLDQSNIDSSSRSMSDFESEGYMVDPEKHSTHDVDTAPSDEPDIALIGFSPIGLAFEPADDSCDRELRVDFPPPASPDCAEPESRSAHGEAPSEPWRFAQPPEPAGAEIDLVDEVGVSTLHLRALTHSESFLALLLGAIFGLGPIVIVIVVLNEPRAVASQISFPGFALRSLLLAAVSWSVAWGIMKISEHVISLAATERGLQIVTRRAYFFKRTYWYSARSLQRLTRSPAGDDAVGDPAAADLMGLNWKGLGVFLALLVVAVFLSVSAAIPYFLHGEKVFIVMAVAPFALCRLPWLFRPLQTVRSPIHGDFRSRLGMSNFSHAPYFDLTVNRRKHVLTIPPSSSGWLYNELKAWLVRSRALNE